MTRTVVHAPMCLLRDGLATKRRLAIVTLLVWFLLTAHSWYLPLVWLVPVYVTVRDWLEFSRALRHATPVPDPTKEKTP